MKQIKYRVRRLEDIAFHVSYKEVLANLSLIPEHRPEEKRNFISYSSLLSFCRFLTGDNVRTFIRNRLDQNLVGTLSDEIRQKFVEEFNRYMYYTEEKSFPWAFFDVVLDENFVELNASVAGPGGVADVNLIPVVAKRSPNLRKLKLFFEGFDRKLSAGLTKPIIHSLHHLKNLTSLTIQNLDKTEKKSLMYLGASVPYLTQLVFGECRITKDDILHLLLGENIQKLSDQNIDEDILHHYQMPSEWITPLCCTLHSLQLEVEDEKKKLENYCEFSSVPPSVIAFCLRHTPKLEEFTCVGSSLSTAVKMLHQNSIPRHEHGHHERDELPGEEHSSNQLDLVICPTGFIGHLSLKSLDFVNIANAEMVEAVTAICPNLEQMVLFEASHGKSLSASDLQATISQYWIKVRHLVLLRVSPDYRRSVIDALGESLTSLTLACCANVSPSELLKCTQLETLKISMLSTLNQQHLEDAHAPPPFKPDSFLPNLKSFVSEICLGNVSSIFQEKSSLIDLDVECCHVGTQVCDWQPSRIIKMWPKVQTLIMRRTNGLDIKTAEKIFTKMGKLKNLGLPHWMIYTKEEREASNRLLEILESQKKTLTFERTSSSGSVHCSLLNNYATWESSDGDSDSSETPGHARFLDFEADIDINWEDDFDSYTDGDFDETSSDFDPSFD